MRFTFFEPGRTEGLLFTNPMHILEVKETRDVLPALQQAEEFIHQGYWLAGYIAYEAAPGLDNALTTHPGMPDFPLMAWGVYPAPQRVTMDILPTPQPPENSWRPLLNAQAYQDAWRRIRSHLHNGETYQVNFTFPMEAVLKEEPEKMFRRLRYMQPDSYAAFFEFDPWRIVSVSPELFFRLDGTRITVRPMKGTARRGLSMEEDMGHARHLLQSEKERAENVMIVDMMRNDLSRICTAGSVRTTRLFRRERHPTVWQMISEVRGETQAGLREIMRAMFPCASVTGAPKAATMSIIQELEPHPRGIYTGSIGYFAPDRTACFNVAIRTVLMNRDEGRMRYGVGSGVTWDSRGDAEYDECLLKARVLTRNRPDFRLLETILYEPEKGCFLLEGHLKRIKASARYFGIPWHEETLRRQIEEAVGRLSSPAGAWRLRLWLDSRGQTEIEAMPFNDDPKPVRLSLATEPIAPQQIWHYHKTDQREIYTRHKQGVPSEADDVLLWNPRREITETTIANILFQWRGKRYTPPISCGVLPGVYRAHLLRKGVTAEKILTLDMLDEIEGMWLINALRKERPVHHITSGKRKWSLHEGI